MRLRMFSILCVVMMGSCVDRIMFDVGAPELFPVVVEGYISDEPGPYRILVTKSFDIESKLSTKVPITVKELEISDSQGNSEKLTEVSNGVYQTSKGGIRGVIGRAYKLRMKLLDGREYETIPDTLYAGGTVDSIYYSFRTDQATDGAVQNGFDIFFNSSAGEERNYYYLWKFVGTYKVEASPELFTEPVGEARVPRPLPCSAFAVVGGALTQVRDCTCCTCWTSLFNQNPIISDNQFVQDGKFRNIRGGYVPINAYTFLYKVHAEVRQLSLSPQAFRFWKGIVDQKESNGSLFQPQSGRILSNFVQISGPSVPVNGFFYASSVKKKSMFITRDDIPGGVDVPNPPGRFPDTCLKLFPFSTTTKPDFWVD